MKILLLVIFALALAMPTAFAEPFQTVEHGKNFDREYLGTTPTGDLVYKWTSAPERLLDFIDEKGKEHYLDYKITQDTSKIIIESATKSILFDKNTCALNVYDGGKIATQTNPMILSHTIKEAINGTDVWYLTPENSLSCNYSLEESNGLVVLTAKKGDFITRYDFDYSYGFEWTYQYQNNKPAKTDHKYGFTFVCDGPQCARIKLNGNSTIPNELTKQELKGKHIQVGNNVFDPKNEEHDYLWKLKKQENKMIVDFTHSKGRLNVGDILIVDPTFSSDNPTVDGYLSDEGNNNTCDGDTVAKYTASGILFIGRQGTAEGSDCQRAFAEYDLSSVTADATVINSIFKFETDSVNTSPDNCDYVGMTVQPSSGTNANLWSNIGSATVMLDNDATCKTVGTNKQVDLTSTGDTYFTSRVGTWSAVGIKSDIESPMDATYHDVQLASEENATPVPKPTLELTYTIPPKNPPTNLSCTSIARAASCTWNAPTDASGISTYYLGKSINNSTFPHQFGNITSTGNVTSFVDGTYYRIGTLYYLNMSSYNGANSTTSAHTSLTMDDVPDAPTLTLVALSSTSINATTTAGASNGGDTVNDFALRCEKNSAGGWINVVTNSSLPSNRKYTYSGNSAGDRFVCQWRDGNNVAWSAWSANATGRTYKMTTATLPMNTTMVGDAFGVTPKLRMINGYPNATIDSVKIYRNGTLIDTDTYSTAIGAGQTRTLSNQYTNLMNVNYLYNHTIVISITNGTGSTQTFTNYTIQRPDYTADYYTRNGYDVNYTLSRTSDFRNINMTVNRDPITFQIECKFKNQLFDDGTWVNRTNQGYFEVLQSVPATQTVYIRCYNDVLIIDTVSYGQFNGTLAILDYSEELGTFFGVPVPFLFIIFVAAIFTGVKAPIGAIFLATTIGLMGAMGFFPDDNGDPLITGGVWSLIVLLAIFGLFLGKKYS